MTNSDESQSQNDIPSEVPAKQDAVELAPNNVALMGVMGSGKSTIGWQLARRLGFGFIDLDAMIEQKARAKISQIFAKSGEEKFRQMESEAIQKISDARSHVIALGGGAVLDDQNWEIIGGWGFRVWLNPHPLQIARRLLKDESLIRARPLLNDVLDTGKSAEEMRQILADRLGALAGQRSFRYEQADVMIDDCFSPTEVIVEQIASLLPRQNQARNTAQKVIPGAN